MSPESDVGVAERPGTHERAEARPRRPPAGGPGRASSQPKPQGHLLSVTLARGRPVSVLVAGGVRPTRVLEGIRLTPSRGAREGGPRPWGPCLNRAGA